MTDLPVPDLMPVLSAGSHSGPREGACVMEMVSYLAGEEWSDSPACTHPVLASMARVVNDRLADSERHRLVPLMGRLFGTAEPADDHEAHVLRVRLASWCARQVLDLARPQDRDVAERAIGAAEGWCEGLVTAQEAAHAAAYAAANAAANAAHAAHAARLVTLLTGLLDEYDRLTGRTAHREVTTDDLTALVELTGVA